MKYQLIIAITAVFLIASCGKKEEPENTTLQQQMQQSTNNSQQQTTNTQTQATDQSNIKKDSVKSDPKKTDDKKTESDNKQDTKTTADNQTVTKTDDKKQNDDDFAAIYAKKCAKCHGKDGHGKPDGAPNLTADSIRSKSDKKLFSLISNGVKNPDPDGDDMPAWKGKLSDDEINSAIKYIRNIP